MTQYPESGGTWYGANKIETSSGRPYDFVEPVPSDIFIPDIAYSLSTQNRFGGHAKPFWSVAQHSVLVVEILIAEGYGRDGDYGLLQGGLLHDAPEAYLLDVPRPAKPHYGQPYRDLTDRAEIAIGARFGILPAIFHDPRIKAADHLALVNEGHRVMRNGPPPSEVLPLPKGMLLPDPWPMEEAERAYNAWAATLELA